MKRLNLFAATAICLACFTVAPRAQDEDDSLKFSKENLEPAEKLIGLDFTETERDSMLEELQSHLKGYQSVREISIDNSVAPALLFSPLPLGWKVNTEQAPIKWSAVNVKLPDNLDELAFYSVAELAALLSSKKVTSMQLTKLALERLKKHDPALHCVITLTEDLALKLAARADDEIAAGNYRGALHGIPYGAKDLFAVKGYKTTWGATPYKDQVIDSDAAIIKMLEEAGAVLVAKLTLGALAWGDVWFGDTTRNPWNPEQGSSGSSAGSASAVAAGLVPFAIGTETWGSIVSPASRCGVTGLRPTFGRVSRAGAMALSWSMDKIGPICRTVEDCAIVFNAIRGSDGVDMSVIDASFNYDPAVDLSGLRIGYLKSAFDEDTTYAETNSETLHLLRSLGANLIEIELPDIPLNGLEVILSAEAAAYFDELTRSNQDDLLVRQIKNAWPNVFRAARFIPAVEYIQANRLRAILIERMAKMMEAIDVYIAPTFKGGNLLLTNLTGHPCVVLPNGFKENGEPISITFMGKLFDEATLLAVARKYQVAVDFHLKRPPLFDPGTDNR